MPSVTVVIPTYNRAKWLPVSVASVRRQTCVDWELLIVDDGSTDNTKEVVDQLSLEDPRIKIKRNVNAKGVSGARNTGISNANAEFIAFLDSDDEWCEFHLEQCLRELSTPSSNISGVVARVQRKRWGDQSLFGVTEPFSPPLANSHDGKLDSEVAFNLCAAGKCPLEIQTLVIRRSAIGGIRFQEDLKMGEDGFFFMELLESGCLIGSLNQIHVTMWSHDSNTTSSGGRMQPPHEIVSMYEHLERLGSAP